MITFILNDDAKDVSPVYRAIADLVRDGKLQLELEISTENLVKFSQAFARMPGVEKVSVRFVVPENDVPEASLDFLRKQGFYSISESDYAEEKERGRKRQREANFQFGESDADVYKQLVGDQDTDDEGTDGGEEDASS